MATEEERAALYRSNQVACRTNLVLNERRLRGSRTARNALSENWRPLYLARLELHTYGEEDLPCIEPLTPSNYGCIC